MPTYDETGSAVAGALPQSLFHQVGASAYLHRRMTVADIIANHEQTTADGYIAINDILQVIHVPAGFSLNYVVLRIITPGTASATMSVGLGAGAEGLAASALDAAAGTVYRTLEAQGWDLGKVFNANDTIDVQVLGANLAIGDFELFAVGDMLYFSS